MSSQLVDLNADGYLDILAGSFSGTPQIAMGAEGGYQAPTNLLDKDGETVLISKFWNREEKKWDETNRCESKGHCTSAVLVDWDKDGDLDLILGDYYGGKLFFRLNEGTKSTPQFATVNQSLLADGQPIVIPNRLSAPVIVDWNQDGLFDLLCGGGKGGVYLYLNRGEPGKPDFGRVTVLLDQVDKQHSFIGKVPAVNNQPTQPGSSYHIEVCDYDGDGDVDLLIGGRSRWEDGTVEASKADRTEWHAIEERLASIKLSIDELLDEVDGKEEAQRVIKSPEYKQLLMRMNKIAHRQRMLKAKLNPQRSGDFVWLFRRK